MLAAFPTFRPNPDIAKIANAFKIATNVHIVPFPATPPSGFSTTMLASIDSPTPTIIALAEQLDVLITATNSTALGLLSVPGATPQTAWAAAFGTVIAPQIASATISVAPTPIGGNFYRAFLLTIGQVIPGIPEF